MKTRCEIANNILEKMSDIGYGHIDRFGKIHRATDPDFDQAKFQEYRLQSFDEIERNRVGVCWDQVEYARHLFEHEGVPVKTYAIVYYDHEHTNYFNHTIVAFEDEGKLYWLEHSMGDIAGIHEFLNLPELLQMLKKRFLVSQSRFIPKGYNTERLCVWEYDKPAPGSTPLEIFKQWESGRNLNELLFRSVVTPIDSKGHRRGGV